MKSKIIKIVIACVIVVGVAAIGYSSYSKNTSKNISVAAAKYYTTSVKKQSLSTTVQGTGTAYAATTKEISANNSGTISGLSAKIGDTVTTGQTLFVCSSDDVSKSVTTAENNLSKQQLTLTSDQTALADSNTKVTSDNQAISEAETALSTAKANQAAASSTISGSNSAQSTNNSQTNNNPQVGGNSQTGANAVQSSGNSNQATSIVDSVTAAQNKLTQLQTTLKNDQNSVKNYTNAIVNDKIAVSEAEADLETAKANLNKMAVTSPIAGLVTVVNNANGDSVQGSSSTTSSAASGSGSSSSQNSVSSGASNQSAGSSSSQSSSSNTSSSSSVLTVVDMNSIKIKISVDELDVSKIKVGQSATIKFDAASGKSFTGAVEQISQTGTTSNNVTTYDVVVSVSNPSGIKIGMSANVAITVESKDNALVIPADALVEKNNKSYVKVQNTTSSNSTVSENSGTLVEVKTGMETLDYIEVTSGLSEGQQVIVKSTSSGMFGNMPSMGNMPKMGSNKSTNSGTNSN